MSDDKKVTMRPEDAIKEMSSLQSKHNDAIKQLQNAIETIQSRITISIDETNNKMKEELNNINDKFTSQISLANQQFNTELKNTKQDMAQFIAEYFQKIHIETKTTQEEMTNTWASVIKEMQEIKHNIADIKNSRSNDEQTQQLDNHESDTTFSSSSKHVQPDHNIPSPMLNADALFNHTNSSLLNNNRVQTIFLPTTTNAPVFHGKPTERPWQFLIRIEEYTETVHMWGEDMLLRGISQFLKDTALEWYCQLRSCNYLPKTWTEFKQAFVKQFNSPIRKAQQNQEWKECKQENDETINEFIIRLRALWVEQFPCETESDLIKHLLYKMRRDMLNIMGYPRTNSLQEILIEAQRVEEIIYHRRKQHNTEKKIFTNPKYDNDSYYKYNNSTMKTNLPTQVHDKITNTNARQQTRTDQGSQQQIYCYNCGKSNHRARDCWYKKQTSSAGFEQATSASKNE